VSVLWATAENRLSCRAFQIPAGRGGFSRARGAQRPPRLGSWPAPRLPCGRASIGGQALRCRVSTRINELLRRTVYAGRTSVRLSHHFSTKTPAKSSTHIMS
jgi:hypothetical protein